MKTQKSSKSPQKTTKSCSSKRSRHQKTAMPSPKSSETEPIPLSVVQPPISLSWKKDSSDLSSLGKSNATLFSSMGSNTIKATKPMEASSSKPQDKVLFRNEICYPYLVKLFYANLFEDICLKSSVLDKDIILTTVYVNNLFDLPNDGACFFSFVDLRNIFWDGKSYLFFGGKALNNLSIDHFFLHKLIYCTLLFGLTTSGGHTIDINTMSIYLSFMAIHEHPVNLGFVILKSIAHSTAPSSKNIPYAMLLTLVFKKENPPKERRIIDLNSLSKMRIQHFETDDWYRGIKKVTKADPIEVSSSADSPPRKCTRISPLF
ncbi:hypothetical protein CDL12_01141 [Handroanthus impetiginosus]|uniref:Uncharacterized protein n=1 Tax=Handroanthus impetiginosus TaxID=429701 RepID=A0A2G9I8M4_9LAMI|nr:hypothetical protein CDL12_01141 [Handroanthus impetiginosus]